MNSTLRASVGLAFCSLLIACNPSSDNGTSGSSSSTSSSAQSSIVSSAPLSAPSVDTTGLSLSLPDGFSAELFADSVPGARVIVKDGMGNYWVSQPGQGTVTQLEMKQGSVAGKHAIFRGLRGPHGLAIDPQNSSILYIAEEHRIVRARLYSDAPLETVASLPSGGRHKTRTLGFGPDGRLYVSIGSTCDVCEEADEKIGTIMSLKSDGTDMKIVARGLRNAVFFRWHPSTRELWATEMGRDFLGDNLPPDEVNIITDGAHYGWPFCYGDRVRDTSFNGRANFDCANTKAPQVQLGAHVAPLGLAFAPSSWPAAYRGDLLVAQHGSWNSSVKVGYSIVRVPQGGTPQEFISGFLESGTAEGRPVDLLIDGSDLLVTDDKRGAIYRVYPTH